MVVLVIFCVLAVVLAGVAVSAFGSRRRLARAGWVECALRSPSGPVAVGLGVRWRHGVATASPGCLVFRSRGPGGLVIPVGRPFSLTVMAGRAEDRGPGRRSAWSINPGLSIAVLDTPDGELELAALEPVLQQVLRSLGRSPDGELRI